jgi:hypothetical protein
VDYKPRVFISHSAHEQLAGEVLEAVEKKLEKAGFDVLVDRTRLEGGEFWRGAIANWIVVCHAAVGILDTRALESPWVRHEMSALSIRRQVDDRFKLLPVLLDGVDENALQGREWSPMDLADLQGVKRDDPAEIAERVREKLEPLKDRYSGDSPIHALERDLAAHLRGVDEEVLEAAAREVHLDISRWTFDGREKARALARKLLESKPEDVYYAMIEIRETEPRPARRIYELAAPFAWVEWDAARAILDALKEAPRGVGLNCREYDTCRMYAQRARYRIRISEVPVQGHEYAAADLHAGIRAALNEHGFTKGWTDDRINERLEHEPVVLVVPFPPPDHEMLDEAIGDLRNLTLFFRAGPEGQPFLICRGLDAERVRYLEPELPRDAEDDLVRMYAYYKAEIAKTGDEDDLHAAV